MIVKYDNVRDAISLMRDKGHQRGENTGFECLDRLYSIKQGTYTFILAAPHHGKSEFAFELAFNQATKYGKKSLIYSPETGSVEDIYAEFIHKYTGRPIYKSMESHVDDKQFYAAINWIDQYFSIVDSDEKSYDFKDITSLVTDEKIVITDPYNELRHEMSGYAGRQDLYIEDLCGDIRRFCKKQNKHWILTLHPANQQIMTDKETGIVYYPMPMARQAAGGQALLRKAMTWINMWRPNEGLKDEYGMPYADNQVLINIEKAKPKGVSTKGETSLFFDWKRNRFYEGVNWYAFDHEQQNKFTMPISEQWEKF